jgi:hypothetical protein
MMLTWKRERKEKKSPKTERRKKSKKTSRRKKEKNQRTRVNGQAQGCGQNVKTDLRVQRRK